MFFPFSDVNPTRRTPSVTIVLILANVAVFLTMWLLPPSDLQRAALQWGFVPARVAQLFTGEPLLVELQYYEMSPVNWQPVIRAEPLVLSADRERILATLVTTMFMHGGWLHLLSNMWFLWLFGNNVEDRLGHFVYLLVYLLGGLLATGTHWLLDMTSTVPVIGASGAVSAVLGAYAVTWPWARVRTLVFLFIFVTIIELPALVVLGGWFLLQVLEATRAFGGEGVGGVAWAAHVGGFAAGTILMPLAGALLGLPRATTAARVTSPGGDPWEPRRGIY